MDDLEIAARAVLKGNTYPYDAPDSWWSSELSPPPPTDWAHAAARGVLYDLQDRGGIKHGFANIDEDIRVEIVEALARIIRAAKETAQ